MNNIKLCKNKKPFGEGEGGRQGGVVGLMVQSATFGNRRASDSPKFNWWDTCTVA